MNVLGIPVASGQLQGYYIWGWGQSNFGQLGEGLTANRSSPVQTISGGTNWTAISVGYRHSAAIKTDGTLWTWGSNGNGNLGDNTVINRNSPVQTISGGTNWAYVATGYGCAAIKTDGTLWTWGQNNFGQLGDNTTIDKSSPVQTVSGGTNWSKISSGAQHILSLKTDNTLWTWGYNNYGQLGDNTVINRSSPVQTIAGTTTWAKLPVTTPDAASGAIKNDGTLWLWGRGNLGQLGDNTITHRSSPVQTVAGGTNWANFSIGIATAAIKNDGTLWTWGYNANGQLGDNTTIWRSSPVQTITGGTNWKQASINNNTIAVKTDGTLWTWGNNNQGQLGDTTSGAGTSKSSPVQTIAGGTNWVSVTSDGGNFVLALRTS